MTNKQVAVLCACIIVAVSGYKHSENFESSKSVWGIASSIYDWLKKEHPP